MDDKFIKIAELELGETEVKRKQSLDHFRSWLSKHPFLKDIRQGMIIFLALSESKPNQTFFR